MDPGATIAAEAIIKQVFARMPKTDNHPEPEGEKHDGLR